MSLAPREIVHAPARRWRSYPEYKDSGVEWLGEISISRDGELKPASEFDAGTVDGEDLAPLSEIIGYINEYYGTDLTEDDKVAYFAEDMEKRMAANHGLARAFDPKINPSKERRKLAFDPFFDDVLEDMIDSNFNLYKRSWTTPTSANSSVGPCSRRSRTTFAGEGEINRCREPAEGAMSRQRVEPGPGQESVWDYPRPPRLEETDKRIKVVFGGVTLAYTTRAKRVLETSHPPVYYVPTEDVRMEHLKLAEGASFCEWKGVARYYDLETEERKESRAAWFYPDSVPAYAGLKDYVAFYPSSMDACCVDGEKVRAQGGDFYGGWITSDIVGPFKGGSGTWGW